ncbi:hypothetical protein HK100_001861 [Physocladia obscura]|uniref:LysM domain-containing protein n=1 Tax=Physocladia obscura TaxID=109957 RepID=A0AAD5SWA0_9FUNG|nr:hypothetical protein HK100_001861 [Physocladia obscura]
MLLEGFAALALTRIVLAAPISLNFTTFRPAVIWSDEYILNVPNPGGKSSFSTGTRRKRQDSGCNWLDDDHSSFVINGIQGWETFYDYVASDLGVNIDSWNQIAFEYPQGSASDVEVCPAGEAVFNFPTSGIPCGQISDTFDFQSTVGGTETATLSVSTGLTTTITSTSQNQVGVQVQVSGGVTIPFLTEAKVQVTTSYQFTSSSSTANAQSVSATSAISASVPGSSCENNQCYCTLSLDQCQYQGNGYIPAYVNGYVWFSWDYQVNGHYNWGYLLESVLSNQGYRTNNLDISDDFQYQGVGTVDCTSSSGSALKMGLTSTSGSDQFWAVVGGSSEGSNGCSSYYTVQSGDSCCAIASNYGEDCSTLEADNPNANCGSNLQVGTVLCIGGSGSGGSSCSSSYTIQSGDSCCGVASNYGISCSELENANPNANCGNNLQVGTVLCIP